MSNSKQVDFKELKARISLEAVLSHYGVKGGVNLDHFGGAKVDQLVKG